MNLCLNLIGGYHIGPLFISRIKRAVVRPAGKEGMIHRAQTKRATPVWADRKAIAVFYWRARAYTLITGELHVVDHIVPKIGKTVCGLHVENNLRVVHWRENAQKGAWVWPDMPMQQISLF